MVDGYLLVHGKMSGPTFPQCSLNPLNELLLANGKLTHYIDYAWSKTRNYNATSYSSADEMHQGISWLKSQGADRVHIVGHSLGGNLGLYYSTVDYQDYDSLIILCPAHNLHNSKFQDLVEWSVNKANQLILSGNNSPAQFIDSNLGKAQITEMLPEVYASYFDSNGPCNMVRSVRLTKTAKPVYMITGELDTLTVNTKALLFNPMLKDVAKSKFEEMVAQTHTSVPIAAAPSILQWVSQL